MKNIYDEIYKQEEYDWGFQPSPTCYKVLQMMPPTKHLKLLDIGCGEGRNSVFFARNGYDVTAFDLAEAGVEKTKKLADRVGVNINVFKANVMEFRLSEKYDILFSVGVFHYIPKELREELFENFKEYTNVDGINMFSVFVRKPFIKPAPERESTAQIWVSGEMFSYYHDWKIDYCIEEIFDCMSSGIPHQHATNRMLAKKVLL